MHIGGLRTALYCWLLAKKSGGEFLLRIEDTDNKRFDPKAEKYIIDALNWLGIIPDHGPTFGDGRYGPYRQSERDYRPFINELIAKGHAYYAFDTADELEAMRKKSDASGKPFSYNRIMRPYMRNSLSMSRHTVDDMLARGVPYVVRFNTPNDVSVRFTDLVRGTIAFNTSSMDDKVLFKSDGTPVYHLAAVVDDHLMSITHVLRGEEWLTSTPLHLLLYDAFEWKAPEFAHLPLLLDNEGKKLSKRNAVKAGYPIFPFTVDVEDEGGSIIGVSEGFKELGYLPDALVNYIALLGWNPKDSREIMSKDELIDAFDISNVNSSGAKIDIKKAAYFNKFYLTKVDPVELLGFLPNNVFNYPDVSLKKIATAGLERISFAKDIPNAVGYFFTDVEPPIGDMKSIDEFIPVLDKVIACINKENDEAREWNAEAIDIAIGVIIKESGMNRGHALNDLRLCLTGGSSGPKLHEMMDMMGGKETLRRLIKAKHILTARDTFT